MASLADLPNNVQRLLDDGSDIDGDVANVDTDPKSTLNSMIKITRPIHAAAIPGNLEILRLLLKKGATLTQSELDMVARENLRQGANVLTDILRARPILKITDNTVMASVRNKSSKEMLSYILDRENHLTQSQLVSIAMNYEAGGQNRDAIESIISYGERINCDKNDMLIAFLRWSKCGYHIGIVLDRYQPPSSMANSILQSAFENKRGSYFMLRRVFWYFRDVGVDIHISPGMLNEVRKLDLNYKDFKIFFNNAKAVVVGTDTLQGLAQSSNGMVLMNLFMDHGSCEFERNLQSLDFRKGIRTFKTLIHLPSQGHQKNDAISCTIGRNRTGNPTQERKAQRHIPKRR